MEPLRKSTCKKLCFAVCLVMTLVAGVSYTAYAHHSLSAQYDYDWPFKFDDAVLTRTRFINPHVHLYFNVKNEKGEVVHWAGEMNSPGVLANTGWTRTTLKKGDQVTLSLRLSKGGNPVGLVSRSSVMVNGKRVESPQAER